MEDSYPNAPNYPVLHTCSYPGPAGMRKQQSSKTSQPQRQLDRDLAENGWSDGVFFYNLAFNPATSCFQSQTTASGVVQFSGGGYGYYTGGGTTAMSLTVKGLSSGGGTDTLTMQGTVNPDRSISGTWTLNGVSVSCSGSGGFTMTRS